MEALRAGRRRRSTLVLLPGLLAAGIGALIFIGLDALTGLGTFSLAIPNLPPFAHPDGAEFGGRWCIGVAAALVGTAIRLARPCSCDRTSSGGWCCSPRSSAWPSPGWRSSTPQATGQEHLRRAVLRAVRARPARSTSSASYTVGALLLLLACKGLAYGVSLSSFRGGPIFPAMFIGAAGGIALSHLPGLPLVAGVAMGIGAMTVVHAPAAADLGAAGHPAARLGRPRPMPLVIVAVVVAYVVSAWFVPAGADASKPEAGDTTPDDAGQSRRTAAGTRMKRAARLTPARSPR